MWRYGRHASAGVSHGLDLACRHLGRPGQTVLVECPTYFLAGPIFEQNGLNVIQVPTDREGMVVEQVERLVQSGEVKGPALVYTIPVYNNPRGTTMSLERRRQLIALAHRHDLHIIADEVCWYDTVLLPTLLPVAKDQRGSASICDLICTALHGIACSAVQGGWVFSAVACTVWRS